MKKQQKKPRSGRRRIFIPALLASAAGVLALLALWIFVWSKPAESTPPDAPAAAPSDQPGVAQNEIAPEEILFSINDKPIPMSLFCYYLYDSFVRLESMFKTGELNFSTDMGAGMTLGQYVIKNAVDGVKFSMVTETLAEELKLDRAKTEAEVDEYLTKTVKETFAGDEASFRDQLAMMGTTTDSFREILISQRLGNQIFDRYYGANGTEKIDPTEYYDRFVTASAILLLTVGDELDESTGQMTQRPLSDTDIAQKRALAETILERLDEGENFYALLNECGEDPGLKLENNPEQCYTFQKNEKAYEFANAAFSMDVGTYSGIVETPHGFYIISRLPLDTEKVDETVKTQEFRSGLFNSMLDSKSKDYLFEPTPLFVNAPLETWYKEFKAKNYQQY